MTLGDFYDCLEGYKDRIENDMRVQDSLNHILGQYVAMGINASKKNPYPKKPLLAKDEEKNKGFTTDSALDAYIMAMAKKGAK